MTQHHIDENLKDLAVLETLEYMFDCKIPQYKQQAAYAIGYQNKPISYLPNSLNFGSAKYEGFEQLAVYLVFLWADLTLFYQVNFIQLHQLYRKLRVEGYKIENLQLNQSLTDDLQQIQLNIPILTEIPKLLASNIRLKDWVLQIRQNELQKAMAGCVMLHSIIEDYIIMTKKNDPDSQKQVTKVKYLYQYILHFRSRYSHEFKKLIKKTDQYNTDVELMRSQINEMASKLRVCKDLMDKFGLKVQPTDQENKVKRKVDENDIYQKEEQKDSAEIQVIKLGKLAPDIQWYSWADDEPDISNQDSQSNKFQMKISQFVNQI
ncbi:UNKNOWN [Stylonychia lemnae]|uniref:Uncharacterized protein n=1 Tax=Stylonychia lemnae TaxID=5949 RepID=A0A078AIK6_STYLE|nr:UNKNOWN [Stylonychia lemnae]|eukprot:CDW82090.1 UNKNOWN [Stylonychia lemnae]